jgi:threonine/homoserine efflux transporter RhtA
MTNEAADVGGAGSLITGVILFIVDKVQLADINDILVTITTLGGAIWMVYKIVGQRMDNKIKKKKLDELEKDS